MRRNYALEDSEVSAGYVLTCQALPTSDELTVDYDEPWNFDDADAVRP